MTIIQTFITMQQHHHKEQIMFANLFNTVRLSQQSDRNFEKQIFAFFEKRYRVDVRALARVTFAGCGMVGSRILSDRVL